MREHGDAARGAARRRGLGVAHDFIARRFEDLVPVLPERRATRAYWLVTHEDTRGLGRIRAVAEHLAERWRGTGGCFCKPLARRFCRSLARYLRLGPRSKSNPTI